MALHGYIIVNANVAEKLSSAYLDHAVSGTAHIKKGVKLTRLSVWTRSIRTVLNTLNMVNLKGQQPENDCAVSLSDTSIAMTLPSWKNEDSKL